MAPEEYPASVQIAVVDVFSNHFSLNSFNAEDKNFSFVVFIF
jgi:hypothetical protein